MSEPIMSELNVKSRGASTVEARLLAIVPARGGSKRLPGKNARPLGGRPLITWSIHAALEAGAFCDVLLSTDDADLAAIGREAGALVPWLRPPELATDTASSGDMLRHALAWYEADRGSVDGVVLLQPTCPFRRAASIRGALRQFVAQPDAARAATVVSVSRSSVPPEWCFRIGESDGALQPMLGWNEVGKRSQDLKAAYHLNGSIYVASSETIRESRPLVAQGSLAFLMDGPEEAIDIDTEDDWRVAESFLPR